MYSNILSLVLMTQNGIFVSISKKILHFYFIKVFYNIILLGKTRAISLICGEKQKLFAIGVSMCLEKHILVTVDIENGEYYLTARSIINLSSIRKQTNFWKWFLTLLPKSNSQLIFLQKKRSLIIQELLNQRFS